MESGQAFKVVLTTIGRKTGMEHSVILRTVVYKGSYYFSRHQPDGDWFQNALKNPEVTIEANGKTLSGRASLVLDKKLNQKISELKYPGEQRAKENRVTIQVIPCE